MAFSAKARISLMARGARFLKVTPCTYCSEEERKIQLVFRPDAMLEYEDEIADIFFVLSRCGHRWTSSN